MTRKSRPPLTWQEERKLKERQAGKENHRSGRVTTPDGPGVVVAGEMRKNTNGGPGTRQWRVQLDDGRIRHYSPDKVRAATGAEVG